MQSIPKRNQHWNETSANTVFGHRQTEQFEQVNIWRPGHTVHENAGTIICLEQWFSTFLYRDPL